jgi:hypothetical protein
MTRAEALQEQATVWKPDFVRDCVVEHHEELQGIREGQSLEPLVKYKFVLGQGYVWRSKTAEVYHLCTRLNMNDANGPYHTVLYRKRWQEWKDNQFIMFEQWKEKLLGEFSSKWK